MPHDKLASDEPVLQPRLIRFIKNRRRLIDFGVREEFLEEMESRIIERRTPDKVSERMVSEALESIHEASFPVFKNRAQNRLEQANQSVLENL